MIECLCELIEGRPPERLQSYSDWLGFIRWLNKSEVLFCMSGQIAEVAPLHLQRMIRGVFQAHQKRTRGRIAILENFSQQARKEHLLFAVIKGIASSMQLYGDPSIRQSGDIDILVCSDDIPKADYVARKVGWALPSEAFRVRRAMSEGRLSDSALGAMQAPFPFRSNGFLPHVSNYYCRQGPLESIEIHDRFHLLDSCQASALLNDMVPINCGNEPIPTLPTKAQALLSILSLHEDADGVRANVRHEGGLGLKACIDVGNWIEKLEDSRLEEIASLAESFCITEAVATASDYCSQLFPSLRGRIEKVGALKNTHWKSSYLVRLADPAHAQQQACVESLSAAGRAASTHFDFGKYLNSGWQRILSTGEPPIESGFMFCCTQKRNSIEMAWRIPPVFRGRECDLAFQAIALQENNGVWDATRVDVSLGGERWEAWLTPITASTFDSHAGPQRGVSSFETRVLSGEAEGMTVCCELPSDVCPSSVVPAVCIRNIASLYRMIAGHSLVELAEAGLRESRRFG